MLEDMFKFKKLILAQVCISVKQIGDYILKSQAKTMNPDEQQELMVCKFGNMTNTI